MALQQTLAAVTKKVIITIDEDDLQLLKKNNYKLCFAKKVGDADYNVVWQSYKKYLSYNEFSWTPQYQLFGTNTFNAGVKVVVSTNAVNIGLGQLSKLNEAGVLSSPVTGGPETGFTMVNEYGSIHPGVKQLCTGIDGTQTSSPIYVSTATAVQGKVTLTPVEKVLVWFEQEVETSTMFSNARSNSIELDLTTDNSLTRHYADQKWVIE